MCNCGWLNNCGQEVCIKEYIHQDVFDFYILCTSSQNPDVLSVKNVSHNIMQCMFISWFLQQRKYYFPGHF